MISSKKLTQQKDKAILMTMMTKAIEMSRFPPSTFINLDFII